MSTHKPGCEALGGYGHGVGKCSCGAEMSDTPRTDANGVVATIYRDGYWSHKMPEQDPFPYLSQHGPIDVCLASELAAERERADRNQEDALTLMRALIKVRQQMFPQHDQRAVVSRDFPKLAAIDSARRK